MAFHDKQGPNLLPQLAQRLRMPVCARTDPGFCCTLVFAPAPSLLPHGFHPAGRVTDTGREPRGQTHSGGERSQGFRRELVRTCGIAYTGTAEAPTVNPLTTAKSHA
jgi:hypothetical protein